MKFLLDESADLPLAAFLRALGYDVTSVTGGDYPRSLKDREILAIAREEGRIVITNDLDFGELVVRWLVPHGGVILFHLETTEDLEVKRQWLNIVLREYADDLGRLIVITDRGVRVRRA